MQGGILTTAHGTLPTRRGKGGLPAVFFVPHPRIPAVARRPQQSLG